MVVLITGGTGFIGLNLVRELVKMEDKVIAYDKAPQTEFLKDLVDKVEIIKGDVLDLPNILHILKKYGVSRVVHAASLLTAASQESPLSALRVNVEGTVNLLEAARIMDLTRVVFLSSIAVYGYTSEEPIDEDYPKNPITIYGATKLASELFGLNYHNTYGVDFIALRFPLVYGPYGTRGFRIIESMVVNSFQGLPVKIPRGGDQRYEPLYVKDAIDAITKSLFIEYVKNRIFNIGSEEMLYLQDIAKIIKEIVPNAEIEIGPGYSPEYPVRGPLNIRRAKEELKYQPRYKIRDGIKDFLIWLKKTK